MKLTEKEQLDLAEEFLEGFTDLLKTYLIKMNLPFNPVIKLEYRKDWIDTIALKELIQVVDQDLKRSYPQRYPNGLKTKNRDKGIVIKRQYLFKIGRDMGLSYEQIGAEFEMNHATVVYGVRTINNMLEVGNSEVRKIVMEVESLIKQYYLNKYGKDISEIITDGNNSKSTLSAMVFTRGDKSHYDKHPFGNKRVRE